MHTTTDAQGYFLIITNAAGGGLLTLADLIYDNADLQNGPESLVLLDGSETVLNTLGYGETSRPTLDQRNSIELLTASQLVKRQQGAPFISSYLKHFQIR